jgi:hypothetical protein
MDRDKIEPVAESGDSRGNKEYLRDKVGKKFDEIFDLKIHSSKLREFSLKEKEKIDIALLVLRDRIVNIALTEKWGEGEIREKIIKQARDNIEEVSKSEDMDPEKNRNFIKIIREICADIAAPEKDKEPQGDFVKESEEIIKKDIFRKTGIKLHEAGFTAGRKKHKEVVFEIVQNVLRNVADYVSKNITPQIGKISEDELKDKLGKEIAKQVNQAVKGFDFSKVEDIGEIRYDPGDIYENEKGEKIEILDMEDDLYGINIKDKDGKLIINKQLTQPGLKKQLEGYTLLKRRLTTGSDEDYYLKRIYRTTPEREKTIKEKIDNLAKGGLLADKNFSEFRMGIPSSATKLGKEYREKAEKYLADVNAKLEEYFKAKKFEFSRAGSEITLERIENYEELNAPTEKEGDEKFLRKTRELWKEFAVHGVLQQYPKTGKFFVAASTDLDGKCSLKLLELAKFNIKNLKYIAPGEEEEGRINIDTSNKEGIAVRGKTASIDHHAPESPRDTSTARYMYRMLVDMGLLKKEPHLDRLVAFTTLMDNGDYPGIENYFQNSWKTLPGLERFITIPGLLKFFKENDSHRDLLRELTPAELKKYGLIYTKKEKETNYCARQEAVAKKSKEKLKDLEREGLIIPSERYGKIAVDIAFNGKKGVPGGYLAARSFGCDAYIIWDPEAKRFHISTRKPITENYTQGKKIRSTMWVKPMNDGADLAVTLKEILSKMTDGKFDSSGKLKKYLEGNVENLPGVENAEKILSIAGDFIINLKKILEENKLLKKDDEKERNAVLSAGIRKLVDKIYKGSKEYGMELKKIDKRRIISYLIKKLVII